MSNRLRSELNVTPLVDIVLVLLIIFIVLTPVVSSVVLLPSALQGRRVEGRAVTLLLARRDGRAVVGLDEEGHSLVPLDAPDPLRREVDRAVDRGDGLVLKADRSLPYRDLDTLLNLVRSCGALDVQLVVDTPAEGGTR